MSLSTAVPAGKADEILVQLAPSSVEMKASAGARRTVESLAIDADDDAGGGRRKASDRVRFPEDAPGNTE